MDLAEVIKSAKGARSYDQLAADAGGTPTSARIQQLATKPVKNFPDPGTIGGLARALHVRERVIVLAAAESLGLRVDEDNSTLAVMLPQRVNELDADQVAAVLQTIRTFLPREVNGGNTAAKTPAVPKLSERRSRKKVMKQAGTDSAEAAERRESPIQDHFVDPPTD